MTVDSNAPMASAPLIELLYVELRQLAWHRLAHERKGHTLQPTALVHEALMRLTRGEGGRKWVNQAHFFAAAAEAMRRILVDYARGRQAAKRNASVVSFDQSPSIELGADPIDLDQILDVDQALTLLETHKPHIGSLVRLHYFAGLTLEEAAQTLGTPVRTAYRQWSYAKAFLRAHLEDTASPLPTSSDAASSSPESPAAQPEAADPL